MKKRLLSLVLSVVMVITLFPATLTTTAHAEGSDNSGAFGISTPSEMTPEEQKAAANNPFGAMGTGAFPLLVKSELFVTYGWDGSDGTKGKNYVKSFDLTDDEGEAEFKVNYGAMVGYNENDLGASGNAYIAAAVDGFNPGSGKDEYVAMLGLNAQDKRLELSITDKNGQPVSVTMDGGSNATYITGNRSGNNLKWLTDDTELYQMNGFLSVASGDFDGDGVDSIIMYEVGAGNSQIPSLREFNVTKNGEFLVISRGGLVMDPEGMYKVLGGDVSSMTATEPKNAPKVQMEAADTDKDGYDELVVTVSMNDVLKGQDSMKYLGTQVFIYDKLSSGWTLTARFSAKGGNDGAVPAVASDNSCADDRYRMVWGTSSVGNVIASDDSGVMTDFPEIVTVGMQDNESKDMHNINVDGDDKLVYSIIHCTGMTETDTGMKNYQGKYVAVKAGTLAANNFTKAGFYEDEDVSPLLQTKCYSYKGAAEAEAVFISGSTYAWKVSSSTGEGELTHLYTQRMFTMSAKMADGDKVSNMQVESVAAGNFDGNDDGREQVAAAFLLKKEGTGNGYIAMKTVGYYGAEDGNDTDAGNWYNGEGDSYFVKKKGNGYVALTDFDCDADSVIVEYEGVEKQWSDPNVMAVLVASPYFHDIGLDNNSSTDYGIDRTTGTSTEQSHTLTTNIVAGFEYTSIFETGGGFEATIENNFTWSTNSSRSITYTTNYSNTTEENQVVVYRSPVLVFKYKDVNTGEMIYLAKTLSPATSMISVEEYNEQAESCGMETIDESTLGIPGLPDTYPSTKDQIQTAFGLQDSDVLLADTTAWANYSSNGVITKSISIEEMKDKSFNYEFDFSFTAYGIIFGAKVGGGAGYGYETTSTVSDGTAIIRSGAVDGVGPGDYDFQWNFATWSTLLNGLSIPVCGYLVKNVTAPPSPGMGLTAESITTDSVTLRWASGIRPAEQYRIYRVLENDIHVLVGAVQGDQTSFTLTGLKSNDAYTYVVRGVSYKTGKAVESVDSTPVTVRPQSENSKVQLTLFKQDGTPLPDDNILQSTGDDAGLHVHMTGNSISTSNRSYQWQLLEAGAEGIKNGWLSVNDLPKSMIGTVTGATGDTLTLKTIDKSLNGSYLRCVVTVTSTAGDLYTYYSPVATLDLNGLDTTTTITVTGNTGGNGSIAEPYTGKADYAEITEVKTPIDVYVPVTVKDSSGNEYTVYKDTDKNVYVGVHEEVDAAGNTSSRTYRVADGKTYALGEELTPSADQYFKNATTTFDASKYTDTGFNGVSTVFETVGTVTYLKQYAVAESSLTEYWYNMTDDLYYTKSGSSFTKASSQPGSNADLRMVYYDQNGTVILSAVGEDNYDHYQVYTVTNGSATKGDSFYRVPGTKLYKSGETTTAYADSANFEAVTVKQAGEYITYTSTPKPGDQLTLKAGVTDQNGTVDTQVTFTITNTDTGAVTQITTTSGAEITWTAPKHGLYRIVATAAATTSTKSSSSECYYRADDHNNSYRLEVKQDGEQVTNISYNGGSVTLELWKRVYDGDTPTSSWQKVDSGVDVSYKVNNTDCDSSYTPDAASNYLFSAVVDGKTVATAVLVVNKVSITVTPTWTGTVPAYNDIELVATDAQGKDVTSLVNGYMTVSCDLYKGTDIDPDAASGVYTVTPAYVSSKMEGFLSRYSVTINTATIYYFSDRITVYFDAGENGEVYASYIDPSGTEFSFSDGSQISMDYGLKFVAEPDSGWSVSTWKVVVPSTDSSTGAVETDVTGYFSRYGSTLKIAKDDLKDLMEEYSANTLSVFVTFTDQTHKITYSAGKGGSLSAAAGGSPLTNEASVAHNATVIFTAKPNTGMMVEKWTVDGADYKWDGTNALYRENTLTLENIDSDHEVKVFFTDADTTTVSVSAVDTTGASYSAATVTVTDAKGNAVTDLTNVPQSSALTFTAKIDNSASAVVKEWQTRANDTEDWTRVTGSGGKDTITIYEHGDKLYVRVVIAVAQTYALSWKIEGLAAGDTDKATLTANSGDTTLTSDGSYAVNTPVDFTLDLDNSYYVVGWTNAAQSSTDPKSATLTLTDTTAVTVTVAKKPIVSWDTSMTGGTISVKGTVNGTANTTVNNGGYVDPNTDLTVTLSPSKGYEVSGSINAAYTDGTGKTTDNKSYPISNVQENQTITPVWKALAAYTVTYSVVDTNGAEVAGGTNGQLTASVSRKGMDAYEVAPFPADDDNSVYAGSTVTFTAEPDQGYCVKEWTVSMGETTTHPTSANHTLTLEDLQADAEVTVQFTYLGSKVIASAGENGALTSAIVNGMDQLASISGEGVTLSEGVSVTFTAEPDQGYEVESWLVNGSAVADETETTYTYVADGNGAVIAVTFRPVEYAVSWSGVNGTVSAEDYDGASASIRGGTEVIFTAEPEDGYVLAGWKVNGETQSGKTDSTFTWKVPVGAEENTEYEIEAVFTTGTYSVTVTDPAHGTISAEPDVTNGVTGGTSVTFTASAEEGYMVIGWTVNGTTTDTLSTTHTAVITSNTTVTAVVVPSHYNVTYGVNDSTGGTLSANGYSESPAAVPYGESVTFTAAPNTGAYYYIQAWQVDDQPVTNDMEGVTVSADKTKLTLSNVTSVHTVEAVFAKTTAYSVSYQVIGSGGSLGAAVNGEPLTLTPGQSADVWGNSELVFTASPAENNMVKEWKINGVVQDNLSNSLTIDALSKNILVTVEFETATMHSIPNPDPDAGYTVDEIIKKPADYGTEYEIRDRGTVTFTVVPTEGKTITALTPSAGTATRNNDGSYTVTVENVKRDIELNVTVTDGIPLTIKCGDNGTLTVMRGDQELTTGTALQAGDKLTIKAVPDSGYRLSSLTVNDTTISSGSSYMVTEGDTALVIEAAFSKSTTPSGGVGGGGGGGAAPIETVIIKDSVNGKVTADNTCAEEGDTVTLTVEPDKGYTLETLIVTDKNGNELKLKDKGDGKYTFTMPASKVTIKATFMEDNSMLNFFVDAPADAYYYDAVLWAATEGITGGVDDTHFAPNATCTRAQIVTFLWRAAGCPEPEAMSSFTDVSADSYYAKAVAWAVENGITKGTGDGTTFSPNAPCTRAQSVTFLWRSQRSVAPDSVNPFTDVAADAYYANAVLWAVENGITIGTGDGTTFSPNAPCTRAQIVTFLYRCMK